MKHHLYNPDFKFIKQPVQFNKDSNKKLLQFCLGATLYIPGTKNIRNTFIHKNKLPGLTSLVLDCEDSISASDLSAAEENILNTLQYTAVSLDKGKINQANLPLLFIRVRNADHFKQFSKKMSREQLEILTGFNFPKFDTSNARDYLTQLECLNTRFHKNLYGLPILESKELAYNKKRKNVLTELKNILRPYKEFILNIRVGATDFSSFFGLRRLSDFTVYDLAVLKECLADILNIFNRTEAGYVISGPVWEYFSPEKHLESCKVSADNFYDRILKRERIINREVDGLLREVLLDRVNGFVGKTIIHPSQIRYVNALQAVTKEEYNDAQQIINSDPGGVLKSLSGNKMNEINPHHSWAEKIIYRADAYGVIKDKTDYCRLIFS